jgi:alkylation response protein AidB-like acyl-CoA dehydrogenase
MEKVCAGALPACMRTSRTSQVVRMSGTGFLESAPGFLARKCTLSWDDVSTLITHTIFEGTSEIQQLVIARAISGLRIGDTVVAGLLGYRLS